jgi:hypothetical protein
MSTQKQSLGQLVPEHQAIDRIEYLEIQLLEERSVPVRAYFKYELAALYGVSMPTFVKYINMFLPEFEAIGYNKRMQRLTPKMVALVFEKLGSVG